MDQNDEWVEAWNCNWVHQAHMLKSVLESEGIDVFLPDEHALGVQPGLTAAAGGVRIMVHASDQQRATELIESVENSTADLPPSDE